MISKAKCSHAESYKGLYNLAVNFDNMAEIFSMLGINIYSPCITISRGFTLPSSMVTVDDLLQHFDWQLVTFIKKLKCFVWARSVARSQYYLTNGNTPGTPFFFIL